MALVRNLMISNLQRISEHAEVRCEYSVINTAEGTFLQLDTFGAMDHGKSQTIRLAPEAIAQLRQILEHL